MIVVVADNDCCFVLLTDDEDWEEHHEKLAEVLGFSCTDTSYHDVDYDEEELVQQEVYNVHNYLGDAIV